MNIGMQIFLVIIFSHTYQFVMSQNQISLIEDFPANPLNKPGYILEFNDEFQGDNIDTSKWGLYYLPQWSSKENSIPNYKFIDEHLILEIEKDQKPWCPEFNGNVKCSSIQTGVFSGKLGTKLGQHRFSKESIVREEQKETKLYTPPIRLF